MHRPAAALLFVLLILLGREAARRPVDFVVYHDAALRTVAGQHELYPPELYIPGAPVDGHGFRYAPGLVFLFVPFAALPLSWAAAAFYALKIAALAWAYTWLSRRLQTPVRVLVLASLILCGGFLVEEIRNGNAHLFVIVLMLVAFDRAERGATLAPGIAFGLSIAAKITPAILGGDFAIHRRWRVAVVAAAVLVAVWLLPVLVWGFEWNAHLWEGFLRYAQLKADEPGNFSLRGWLGAIPALSPTAATTIWLTIAVACGALYLYTATRPARPFSRELDLAMLLTAMPLLSPHTQRIHFSGLFVPLAIAYVMFRRSPADTTRVMLGAALFVVTLAGTVMPLVLTSRDAALRYLQLSPYALPTLLLFVALSLARGRSLPPNPIHST